jgi:urea transport system substrate-binding protein
MLIDSRTKRAALLGCEIEAVVVDPASDWPLLPKRRASLLTVHEVDVIFGNWTSRQPQVGAAGARGTQRPDVLPGPVRGRGKLQERVLHRRRAQPAGDPGTDYFLEELGVEKFALLGTDYVYPRTTNNILEAT